MSIRRLKAGLIGSHIQKTRLPAALKIMCEDAAIELDFALFDTADMQNFEFVEHVERLIQDGWNGITITHPYKLAARKFAASGMIGELAHLNACNTIRFGSDPEGFNTDYSGFLHAWASNMGTSKPGKVAIAGAGGVANALAPALASLGATQISIWDLDFSKAASLANDVGPIALAVPKEAAMDVVLVADGLVNATALGMQQYPGSAFDPSWIGSQTWAFDAVYTPANTEFTNKANSSGLKTISGFELFKHMAMSSFSAYTGLPLDKPDVLARLEALKPE